MLNPNNNEHATQSAATNYKTGAFKLKADIEQQQQEQHEHHKTTITNKYATQSSGAAGSAVGGAGSADVERKYGKIPAEIYLLYMRASGFTIVFIFFITALIWQALRVYTDVWLQQWTDDNSNSNYTGNNNAASNSSSSSITDNNNNNAAFLSTSAAIPNQQHSIRMQQMMQKYAKAYTRHISANDNGYRHSMQDDTATTPTEAHHEVTYYFHIYTVISFVCILMAMLSTPAGQWAGCKARQNLHDKLLQTIMHKSLHFFQITPLGRIMNRFSNDMAIIDKVGVGSSFLGNKTNFVFFAYRK